MYNVKLAINLDKVCKKYPKKDRIAIFRALEELKSNPRPVGVVKLSGRDGYRIRVGGYRIIYHIKPRVVTYFSL